MASKFDDFLKAFWNTIFSVQEAPRRPSAADRRRRWSRPEPSGGGLRRGKTDVQAPRRVDVRNLALEGLGRTRRPGDPDLTRRPRLGGGLRKAAPWYRRASLDFRRI